MSQFHSLRRRVAASLWAENKRPIKEFHKLPDSQKKSWLDDADRVIPMVLEACANVVDQKDPEKPANYLIKRENCASVIKGLFVGNPEWECPIDSPGCFKNCGSYGCGN
jgi:hypothetical protein